VFGSFDVRTKRGLGLVPIRTQEGLRDGSMSGPKGIRVWVLRCPTQGVWGWVLPFRTQVGLGVGSCPDPRAMRVGQVGTQGGWGMGPCPDPRGLGPRPHPTGLGFGFFGGQTQRVWVLSHPDLKGLGSSAP
jgi:hypothetical protein